MGKHTLVNVRLFTGGADLTTRSNKLEVSSEVEEKDVTCFTDDDTATQVWREVIGGIASTQISAEGAWEAGDPGKVDNESWAGLGGVGPWTMCPRGAAVGSVAWLTRAMRGQYTLLGDVGEVAPWQANATGSWPLVRGKVLHPPGTARTTTGSGTGVQHVAVPAGQHLYAALHVLSVSGTGSPTLTVAVESDVDDTFASPTEQITFNPATTLGGQIARAAGPITDTWYRVTWEITGTTPSFLFVVSLGVG